MTFFQTAVNAHFKSGQLQLFVFPVQYFMIFSDCDTRDAHAPYSWHAQIIYEREARCSGALVHPEWVITSADCVTE